MVDCEELAKCFDVDELRGYSPIRGFNREERRVIAASLRELRANNVRGWRAMETAPKDGTWVLLHEGFGVNTKWSKCEVGSFRDGDWRDGGHHNIPAPSHWMPLPPSP